ncbi:histidine phosphatase family protein [Pararhizobium sp. BT-229]|uniref:SixA phosphatase family protein n=1 Tax=Pararhizobium sp. BT-229 TaxID=2986923 RepID=UPI0021F70A6F|nr:histidine phosphatase family protein [Pararhizobium sp. BT-229]MCV9960573.1 histidine phosphatase family protein [Pararhizobium sp. BT-229]
MPSAPTPVFRLYLLRHARAGWTVPGQKDFDRTLDDTGFAQAEIVADKAADLRLVPDLVLCSTAVRCRQTAEAFRRAMGEELDIRCIDALYTGSANAYRDCITGQAPAASLMIVGHNPVIEEILHGCLSEQTVIEAIPAGYPPGALAVIDFDQRPEDGNLSGGTLTAWIDPESHSR